MHNRHQSSVKHLGCHNLQLLISRPMKIVATCPMQIDAFMGKKEQDTLELVKVLVSHQKAVFTSNPSFDKVVSEISERVKLLASERLANQASPQLTTSCAPATSPQVAHFAKGSERTHLMDQQQGTGFGAFASQANPHSTAGWGLYPELDVRVFHLQASVHAWLLPLSACLTSWILHVLEWFASDWLCFTKSPHLLIVFAGPYLTLSASL